LAEGDRREGEKIDISTFTPTLSPAFAPQGGASRRQASRERGKAADDRWE